MPEGPDHCAPPALLGDTSSHEVRRAAALLFDTCVRVHLKSQPTDAGSAVLSIALFEACQRPLVALLTPLPELVKVVDLGPFKHRVDEGVELRRAAYDALLAECECGRLAAKLLPWDALLESLATGLADDAAEVKLNAHTLVGRICELARACSCHGDDAPRDALVKGLEAYAVPLTKTLTTRLRAEAVKQEVERHEEMLMSCLRACASLAHVAAESCGGDARLVAVSSVVSATCPAFGKLLSAHCESGALAAKYALAHGDGVGGA